MTKLHEVKEHKLGQGTVISYGTEGRTLKLVEYLRWIFSKSSDDFLNEIEWMVAEEKAKRIDAK